MSAPVEQVAATPGIAWRRAAWVLGPGLMVMLADADTGGARGRFPARGRARRRLPPRRADRARAGVIRACIPGRSGARASGVASVAASLWSHQPLGSRSYLTLALGIAGAAALLASIVVSLAASWAVAEAFGARRSLDDHPRNARLFYGIYTASVTVGAAVVLASHSIVRVAVDVEVLNALLLPVVIGFLVALAWRALPHPYRLRAGERVAIAAIVAGVAGIGLGWAGLTILPR